MLLNHIVVFYINHRWKIVYVLQQFDNAYCELYSRRWALPFAIFESSRSSTFSTIRCARLDPWVGVEIMFVQCNRHFGSKTSHVDVRRGMVICFSDDNVCICVCEADCCIMAGLWCFMRFQEHVVAHCVLLFCILLTILDAYAQPGDW